MPQNEMELEKESASGVERLLFFLIPIVFTIVLVVVLLTLFNTDFKNGLLKTADKIPVVKNWVPEPDLTPEEQKAANEKAQDKSSEATIEKLKSELSQQEAKLKQTATAKAEQDKKVQDLEAQLQSAKAEQESAAAVAAAANSGADKDPYLKQIKNLSSMYETMSPSKAAPILSNLTNPEIVQMLTYMAPENQSKILAKMDPQKAAEITMDLKNTVNSSDLEVAALQARLQKDQQPGPTPAKTIDDQALGGTFASMKPAEGAKLILETYKLSPEKALNILRTVDDSTRSGLLEEMSKSNSAQTAKILNKLLASK
ncbi:MotE family protein [Paenibacillus medicaginis]|uniref:MotE family protein n=1 Tax=Paenibacillus medicaginis TaxID=1470560 RepID=A0ABV5BX69_9BACL